MNQSVEIRTKMTFALKYHSWFEKSEHGAPVRHLLGLESPNCSMVWPKIWLSLYSSSIHIFKESWNAPMKSLECYLVPISITAVNTAWERTCYIVYAIPSERIYWDLKSIFWERNTCKNHWQWANARQINSKENEDSFIFYSLICLATKII